jgi:hypothetical protein
VSSIGNEHYFILAKPGKQDCKNAIVTLNINRQIRKTAGAVLWLCAYQIILEYKGMVLLLALPQK